jgi:hypothetical protein
MSGGTSELLKKHSFLKSLETCKALIVLTNHLKHDLATLLCKVSNVPIYTVYHPTDLNVEKFNFDNFRGGIVQVGAWMRRTSSIFKLRTGFTKKALKGHNMDNYYPTPIETKVCKVDICRSPFLADFKDILPEEYKSVDIIQRLDNIEYDKLLQTHCVFIHLIDASAVNTLIECLARHCPILVNKIPPVVEILGDHYPLYYTDLDSAGQVLNYKNVLKAHLYMRQRDLTFLNVKTFIQCIKKIMSSY